MMTLRIVHAITPAEVGGLESAVRLLASAQCAAGHDVHVLATVERGDAEPRVVRALRNAGASVTTIVAPGRAYLREWRSTASALAALHPDVVHTHGYRADLLAGFAARRAHVPVVTTLHGFVGGDWKLRAYERLQRRTLNRFDAVVAVSARMGAELAPRVATDKLFVIPNGYAPSSTLLSRRDARRALGIPLDRFQLGWIGRLSHEKGPDVMIRAMATEAAGDAHLSLIGDGPDRARTEALAAALGVTDRVAFHGVRHDASALLGAFDAIVLSSRTEGTPIVLLEAMSAGAPVIATAVGGVPDMVQDAHALLVPPESPDALGDAIAAVRDHPDAARVRAARATERLRTAYAVDRWMREYDRVYRTVLHVSAEPQVA